MSTWNPQRCTFGGVAFYLEQKEGLSRPEPDDKVHYSVYDIPYSDRHVIQIGGRESVDWALDIYLASAGLPALKALKGVQGAITVLGEAARTATLLTITRIRDHNLEGYVACTATWRV